MHWNRVIRTWHLVLILIAVSLGPRFALLLTTERTPDADECIVGLMAMHISQGERPPVFFYGQHYGGGHVIEALGAAPWFYYVGVNEVAVQAVPVAFSVALVLLVFFWMGRVMGQGAGFVCALSVAFSTPFLKSSFKADGYIETIFLGVLSFYLFERMFATREGGGGGRSRFYPLLIGAVLGAAWWSYDFGLIYLGALVIMGFARRRRLSGKILAVFAVGFLLGASLLIYDNLTSDFENIKHLLFGRPLKAPPLEHAAWVGSRLVRGDFAAFLTRNCLHNFEWDAVPLSSWIHAALIAFGAAVSFVGRKELKLPAVMFLFPAIYFLLYLISPHGGQSPRYLLPLEPFLSVYLVGAVVYFLRGHNPVPWAAGVAMFVCIVVVLALGFASIRADDGIVEGNVRTDERSLTEVIEFLDSKGIDCVYSTYFIKWRILFESREKINVVALVLNKRQKEFSRYEDRGCPSSAPPVVVLHKRSELLPNVIYNLSSRGMNFGYHHTTDHMIVYVK